MEVDFASAKDVAGVLHVCCEVWQRNEDAKQTHLHPNATQASQSEPKYKKPGGLPQRTKLAIGAVVGLEGVGGHGHLAAAGDSGNREQTSLRKLRDKQAGLLIEAQQGKTALGPSHCILTLQRARCKRTSMALRSKQNSLLGMPREPTSWCSR